jgi:ATP-dependent DNA helicase DinG
VDGFFGPGGRLEQVLPGYEPRAEQAALADAVALALGAGEHLLAEAGTGTGKSLAYLIPALESGQRVVVSTATKALQEQLLTKDVPVAAAALGRDVRVAVLKGRQNYLCRNGLQGFGLLGAQLFPRAEDAAAFDAMRGWIETTETGDRAELEVEPPGAVWAEIAVGADRCLGRLCAFTGVCFSEAARERASHAELIVVNHALYFADLGLRSRTDSPAVLPEHDAVVFDEAHRLEESAATWLGGRVSMPVLHRLLRDTDRACREAALPAPARALDRVEAAAPVMLAPGHGSVLAGNLAPYYRAYRQAASALAALRPLTENAALSMR